MMKWYERGTGGSRRRGELRSAWQRRTTRLSLLVVVVWAPMLCGGARADTSNLQVRGLIDLVAHANDQEIFYNTNNLGDSSFDNVRSRLFIEGGSERTRAFVQVLFSDVGMARIRLYGAYLTHRVFEEKNVFFEAGKIPSHDGIWAPDTYSNRNPLVGVPLAYYYNSTLPSTQLPVDLAQLVSRRGTGQAGVTFSDANGVRGGRGASMPILYDNCWDYGAYVIGSGERYDYAVGLTVGSPGAPVAGPDTNGRPSWHVRLGVAPTPGLRLHGTVTRGPYLSDDVEPYLAAGSRASDYAQMLYIASLQWDYHYFDLKSEAFFNHYETPLREEGLGSFSHYATLRYKFLPGWYAALRYDWLRFEEIVVAGEPVSWDDNVRRAELGVGYHVTHDLLVKAVGQVTDVGHAWGRVLPAMQFSYRF